MTMIGLETRSHRRSSDHSLMQSADIAKLIFPRIDIIEMDALADAQMAKACNAHDLPSYADTANILDLADRPSGFAETGPGSFHRAAASIAPKSSREGKRLTEREASGGRR